MKTNVEGTVTISVELFDKYRKAYEDAPCIIIKHQWSGGFCGCDESVTVLNTGEETKFSADLMRDSEDDKKRVEKYLKTIDGLQRNAERLENDVNYLIKDNEEARELSVWEFLKWRELTYVTHNRTPR